MITQLIFPFISGGFCALSVHLNYRNTITSLAMQGDKFCAGNKHTRAWILNLKMCPRL